MLPSEGRSGGVPVSEWYKSELSSLAEKCQCSFPSFTAATLVLWSCVFVLGKVLSVVQASEVNTGTVYEG